jgi:Fe2+ transport system protein FeoA
MRRRLADMGLTLNMPLRVVQRNGHGPLILAVKDSRLAIGRGMAHHIMVEPI